MRLILGLGNPEARYRFTRHNIGALAVVRAAEQWGISGARAGLGRTGSGRRGQVEVVMAIELAWMNQSGPAVAALLGTYELQPENLVVVHDDLDLPLGRIRIKRDGGAGGHNGVLSLLTEFGTDQFCRLKIGIGSPPPQEDPADYVLSLFLQEELPRVDKVLEYAVDALDCLLLEGVDAAMNRFNAANPTL